MKLNGVARVALALGLAVAVTVVASRISHTASADGGVSASTEPAIVFERHGDLYATSVEGTRTVRLTQTRVREWQPAVSPDGTRIAFSRGGHGLSTMKVDGSELTIWTRGPDGSPAWAPDGRTIYFIRFHGDGFGGECGSIFSVSSTRPHPRRVTNTQVSGHSHLDPAVSPDGRRIAVTDWNRCQGGTASPRLRVVDTDGRPTRELARLRHNGYYPDPEHSNPAWSPDGERLAFIRSADLTIANRDGSDEHRVARGGDGLIYVSPAWSADGQWIAFERSTRGGYALLVVHPDGSGLHRVARFATGAHSLGNWLPALPK